LISLQRPIYSNFGAPINLTRTSTATQPIAKLEKAGEICPYKGLQYFDTDDADYFYGREELTDTLLNKIRAGNFFAILGASGSGKSSVLRAGLVHQLQLGYKLANSKEYKWITDESAYKQYIDRLKKDKSSDPKTPPDCSKWKQ
jgi:ABC-type transport system involved in cytochrome bd biosynthesis fused ATPase/permease subunit